MTMTDAELAEIRARVDAAANHSRVDAEQQELLEYDIPALLVELAAAREVITAYAHADPSLYGDICDCDGGDCARRYLKDAALHSATEDADDS